MIAFVTLILGYQAMGYFEKGNQFIIARHLSQTQEEYIDPTSSLDNKLWLIGYSFGVLYMFVAIAVVCDELFVPALEEIASDNHLNLSMDVAGATLMAAGGSAPELFTSLIGTFQESEVGFGTIVGSAVFNVLFVIGMCAIFSKDLLTLTWWPLARDCTYYTIGLATLAIFCGYISPGEIEAWEAAILFFMYIGYVMLMKFNEKIWYYIQSIRNDGRIGDENIAEKKPTVNGHGTNTLRAGLLNLFMGKGSLLEKVGIAMITSISGDVHAVFRRLDSSGDGFIDRDELKELMEMLGTVVTEDEIDSALYELDENNDGKVDLKEFTKWYIKSELRLKSELRTTFDEFDVDNSGTIDGDELRELLKALGTKVNDVDVQATLEEAHITGPLDQISFEEFELWYTQSKYWEQRMMIVQDCADEAVECFADHIKPPQGEGIISYMIWIVLLPIVFVLSITVPDVRRPGNSGLCFFSFFLSILWIATFTYFMVDWAGVIGNTLGIPMVLMGLTILAAGTSVPDLLSSIIVARMGEGDMAVSSSIGSNIFDITVGLPIPWLLFHAIYKGEKKILIETEGMTRSIIILLIMLVSIVVMIHVSGWKMTKGLGIGMLFLYACYILQAILFSI
jgi:sodium/potassium/calcium exchanger 2